MGKTPLDPCKCICRASGGHLEPEWQLHTVTWGRILWKAILPRIPSGLILIKWRTPPTPLERASLASLDCNSLICSNNLLSAVAQEGLRVPGSALELSPVSGQLRVPCLKHSAAQPSTQSPSSPPQPPPPRPTPTPRESLTLPSTDFPPRGSGQRSHWLATWHVTQFLPIGRDKEDCGSH